MRTLSSGSNLSKAHNTTGCGFGFATMSGSSSFYQMPMVTRNTTVIGEIVYDQFGQPFVFDGTDWTQSGDQGWVPIVGRIETLSDDVPAEERLHNAVGSNLTQVNLFDDFDLDVDMADLSSPNDSVPGIPAAAATRRRSSALFAPRPSALSPPPPISSPSFLFPTTSAPIIPGPFYAPGAVPSYLYNYAAAPLPPSAHVANAMPVSKRFAAHVGGGSKNAKIQKPRMDRDDVRAAIHTAAALHRAKAGIANRTCCGVGEPSYGHNRFPQRVANGW